jgi:hypothetical protein
MPVLRAAGSIDGTPYQVDWEDGAFTGQVEAVTGALRARAPVMLTPEGPAVTPDEATVEGAFAAILGAFDELDVLEGDVPEYFGGDIQEGESPPEEEGTDYEWNPADHPRWPSGDRHGGGRFRPKMGGGYPDARSLMLAMDKVLGGLSRTASGVSDTSVSEDKPELDVKGDELKRRTKANVHRAMLRVWSARDREFRSPRQLRDLVETLIEDVNRGLVDPPLKQRTWSKDEFGYSPPRRIPRDLRDFYREFYERLDRDDPVQTAAWVERRFDMQIHALADGQGRSTKAISAFVLARHGMPLPEYPDRKTYYSFAKKPEDEWLKAYRGWVGRGSIRDFAFDPSQPRDRYGRWRKADFSEGNAAILEYMSQLAEMVDHPLALHNIVRAHGRVFDSGFRDVDPDETWTEQKACYRNAANVAIENGWTYVEGLASPDFMPGLPIHHAWAVTPEGHVYDPTWNNRGAGYVGVPFRTDYLVDELERRGVYGLLSMPPSVRTPTRDDLVSIGEPIPGM